MRDTLEGNKEGQELYEHRCESDSKRSSTPIPSIKIPRINVGDVIGKDENIRKADIRRPS